MSLADIAYIQPRTILDCGANIGAWALEAHTVWPDARILMIEGNEACWPALAATGFEWLGTYVSNATHTRTLFKRKGGSTDTGNSFYRENTQFFADDQITRDTVLCSPLSKLVYGETFDFIKCDAQGAELDIIRGGVDIVKAAQHVLLEVSLVEYNLGSPLEPEVLSVMDSLGFTSRKCIGDICHPIQRDLIIQKDILFSK